MSETVSYRMSDEAKSRIAQVYNQVADSIESPPLMFWDRIGCRTVDRIGLQAGAKVLDVGCGAGAAVLAAAAAVGENGHVIGVDIAEALLAHARRRSVERQLKNVTFMKDDMTQLAFTDESFDVVISVFSVFFVDDMEGFVKELWRMVAPGGKLVITTWAPPIFEPLGSALHFAALPELPNLSNGRSNMDLVMHPHLLENVMRNGGATNVYAETEEGSQYLPSPDDWWTMALGSGLRRIIAALPEDGAARVRKRLLQWVKLSDATFVSTNAVYGVATKWCDERR